MNGDIKKITPDGSSQSVIANTGGRPLGVELHPDGGVLVCDAFKGLFHVTDSEVVRELLSKVEGQHLVLTNNASIAADGRIFFTESSRRWDFDSFTEDIFEMTATGRLLVLHPNGEVEQLLDGLAFANGVALAPDESFVLDAETGKFNTRHASVKADA